MHLAGYYRKSNYVMTDDELRQWQRTAMICCEFDNFFNNVIDNAIDVTEFFEESAINMAIEAYGIQRRQQRALPNSLNTLPSDDFELFNEQAIDAAIEAQGLGRPPPS